MYTTPKIALAMFIMAFVGVVRGLWGSKKPEQEYIRQNHPFTKPPFCFLSNFSQDQLWGFKSTLL